MAFFIQQACSAVRRYSCQLSISYLSLKWIFISTASVLQKFCFRCMVSWDGLAAAILNISYHRSLDLDCVWVLKKWEFLRICWKVSECSTVFPPLFFFSYFSPFIFDQASADFVLHDFFFIKLNTVHLSWNVLLCRGHTAFMKDGKNAKRRSYWPFLLFSFLCFPSQKFIFQNLFQNIFHHFFVKS